MRAEIGSLMESDYSRRKFLRSAAAGAALTALPPSVPAANSIEEVTTMPVLLSAFASTHQPKALAFDPAKLDGLSEKLIRSDWENNYGGSVKALNAIKQRVAAALADAEMQPYVYNDLKREHLMRTGSVVLHELYFDNLGGGAKAEAALQKRLEEAFFSMSTWEKEFRRMGAGLGGGSGWVVLGYNLHHGLLENYWQWDHLHAPSATLPILVMDMYEHSYQMDYGAGAAAYVDAFFRNIQWEVVASRLEKAIKARAIFLK